MTSPRRLRQTIEASAQAASAFLSRLQDWCDEGGIHPGVAGPVGLMMDEWLVNLRTHAYGGRGGPVEITIDAPSPRRLDVLVRDQAPPFDPTAMPPPDLHARLEERELGGLGVHFIRRMASQIAYRREGQTNELRFTREADKP